MLIYAKRSFIHLPAPPPTLLIGFSWGEAYTTLQPRITKTLVHAWLDSSKPLATHYGAIKGLTGLGRHTIQLLLVPNLAMYVLNPRAR